MIKIRDNGIVAGGQDPELLDHEDLVSAGNAVRLRAFVAAQEI